MQNKDVELAIKLQIFSSSRIPVKIVLSWKNKENLSNNNCYTTNIFKTTNLDELTTKIFNIFPSEKIQSKYNDFIKFNFIQHFQNKLELIKQELNKLEMYEKLFYEEKYELKMIVLTNGDFITDRYSHNLLYVYTSIDTHYYYGINESQIKDIVAEIKKEYELIQNAISFEKDFISKVLFSEKAAAGLVHEAFGHFLEEDIYSKNIKNYFNSSNILPKDLKIYDDPTIKGLAGSYNFDDEGVKSQKKEIIKNGKIINLIGCSQHQNNSQIGNGRCVDYTKPLLSRQSNFYIEGSDGVSDEELFEKIKDDGYYIISAGVGNFYGLKFDLEIKLGFYYLDGQKQYFKNCRIEGNTIDLLKNIIKFGNKTRFYNIECCHYNQYYYEVSAGSPKILVDGISIFVK